MKTLLTGANGLVGSTLDADVKISGRKEVDLRNWGETYAFFKKHQPTHVIHTAAKVGGLGANINYMGEFFYDNMMINLNVLEAARRVKVEKVVSFLSTCVFPDAVEYPLTEEKLHSGEPHLSNYGYAYAKRMLDVQSRAYNQQYGVTIQDCKMIFGGKYVSVIPTNIYGPHDNFELENSHVVPALIHKCYLAKENKTDLMVWGSGSPLREFIHAEDVGDLTQHLLEEYEGTEPVILSNSEEVSIRQLVRIIVDAMGYEGRVIFNANQPDGQLRKPTSNSKLQEIVPNYRFTPLSKGIKYTVKWFIKNYETCRK
jgi:GDP-L-fucose synthase